MTEEASRSEQSTKVFIAGAPRTGTSILVFAIKEVFGLPGYGESHVMPVFQRMIHHLREYTDSFSKVPDQMMLKELNRQELERYLSRYIRDFYSKNYPKGSWIDKTPTAEAVFGLPYIEAIFPEAKLIATRRNGIEVVVSHLKKFNSNFDDACSSWLSAMQGLLHAREGCKNLLEVDQFELLNNTKDISLRIARHLGHENRAASLANYFETHEVERSSTHDRKNRLLLDKVQWTDAEKDQFRSRCGGMMEAFGYEL